MAKRDMKFSDFDLCSPLSSISLRIRLAVESPNTLVVLTLKVFLMFTHPLSISSPASTSLGADSPVNAAVLRVDSPSVTTPSMGTFSPFLMTISVPTLTSSGFILIISPDFSTLA